jgi:hypothetical protein
VPVQVADQQHGGAPTLAGPFGDPLRRLALCLQPVHAGTGVHRHVVGLNDPHRPGCQVGRLVPKLDVDICGASESVTSSTLSWSPRLMVPRANWVRDDDCTAGLIPVEALSWCS